MTRFFRLFLIDEIFLQKIILKKKKEYEEFLVTLMVNLPDSRAYGHKK